MHNRIPFTPHLLPPEVNLVEMLVRSSQLLATVDILDFCLLRFDAAKRVAVAGEELGFLAEGAEADGVGVDAVQPGEG